MDTEEIKRPALEVNYSRPSGVDVMYDWSCMYVPPYLPSLGRQSIYLYLYQLWETDFKKSVFFWHVPLFLSRTEPIWWWLLYFEVFLLATNINENKRDLSFRVTRRAAVNLITFQRILYKLTVLRYIERGNDLQRTSNGVYTILNTSYVWHIYVWTRLQAV